MSKKRKWKTTKAEDAWQVLRIQGEFTKGFDQLSEIGPCISIFGLSPDVEYSLSSDSIKLLFFFCCCHSEIEF